MTAIGGSTSIDHVDASTAGVDAATMAPLFAPSATLSPRSVLNAAANGQQIVKLSSWLDVSAGARLDWRQIDVVGAPSQTIHPVFMPRLALTTRPWSGATTKLIDAEAFRAPNPFELDANSAPIVPSGGLNHRS